MAKRSGYVYHRPGRSQAQVTGAGVRLDPSSYATHGRTAEDRAKGKLMLSARRQGWDVDPTELDSDTLVFGRMAVELHVSVRKGQVVGSIRSTESKYKAGNEREARLSFDPRRTIPSPAAARSALARRRERIRHGAGVTAADRED
jgi:hypothetical protein